MSEGGSVALGVVDAYYNAYRAGDAEAVSAALREVMDENVVLDSPILQTKLGQPLRGRQEAIGFAATVAPILQNATVEGRFVNATNANSISALIHFPTPAGVISQAEYFDIDPATKKITRLRSYYDPRKLLAPTSR